MKIKEFLFYLLLTSLWITGCIKEDLEGCFGNIYLDFQYKGSTELFDRLIGNDIYLQMYCSGVLHTAIVLPFDDIKGGSYYVIPKGLTGEVELVAWTVPAIKPLTGMVPQEGVPGGKKGEQKIVLEVLPGRGNGVYQPLGFLHRGSCKWVETDTRKDRYVSVSLLPAVCRLMVTLHGTDRLFSADSAPGIEVFGLQRELNMDLIPSGDDAVICGASSILYTGNKWNSGDIFLPPSLPGKSLSVKIIPSEGTPFTVHTDYASTPGDFIHLELTNDGICFFVNGWRTENFYVENL